MQKEISVKCPNCKKQYDPVGYGNVHTCPYCMDVSDYRVQMGRIYKIQCKHGKEYFDHATLQNMDKKTAEYWLTQVQEKNKEARIVKQVQ